MLRAAWMTLLGIGMLLPVAVLADDDAVNGGNELLPVSKLSLETILADADHAARWPQLHTIDTTVSPDSWPGQLNGFEFRDSSTLSRVSKLRNLSLLTLAETGQSRLFIGVNDDGLLGLHFRAFTHRGDERYMEVVRMPYLSDSEPEPDVQSTEHYAE